MYPKIICRTAITPRSVLVYIIRHIHRLSQVERDRERLGEKKGERLKEIEILRDRLRELGRETRECEAVRKRDKVMGEKRI